MPVARTERTNDRAPRVDPGLRRDFFGVAWLGVLERQRLDKWLWHARVVRARTHAAALVEAGHVRVNGAREKSPGHSLKVDDVLTIRLDRSVRILRVTGFADRRGNATAAKALYDEASDVSGGS